MSSPRGLGWPLGPAAVLLPAFAVSVAAFVSTVPMLGWPYQEWVFVSAQFHQQFTFAGPIAAATATYHAGRVLPPTRITSQPGSRRPAWEIMRQQLGWLTALLVAAYVLGLLPLLVAATVTATYGGPDVLAIFTGVAAIIAAILVGHLIGVIGRSALLAPMTFILCFAAAVAGFNGDAFAAVSPTLHVDPRPGQSESVSLSLFRVLVFGVVGLTAALLSRFALDHRPLRMGSLVGRAATAPAAGLAAAALLLTLGIISTPRLFSIDENPPRVCAQSAGVELCVHQSHRKDLPEIVSALSVVLHRHGQPQSIVSGIYDDSLDLAGRFSYEESSRTLWLQMGPEYPPATNVSTLISTLSGEDQCLTRYRNELPARVQSTVDSLRAWLSSGVRDGQGSMFSGWSPDAIKAWIAANQRQILRCDYVRKRVAG